MDMSRRGWIGGGGALAISAALAGTGLARAKPRHPFQLTDADWRKRLSPAAYQVLRQDATERAWTSPLLKENRRGVFVCAGCGQPLFASSAKYDSGTGWPSFRAPIKGAIVTATDYKIGVPRTEARCARCAGHLGHVFDDGPRPTGKRYCINGAALRFLPA